jgi:hypothetical protein
MTMTGAERRVHQRVPQRNVMTVAEAGVEQLAVLKDISRSGVLFEVEKTVTLGCILTIDLPKSKFAQAQKIPGRVMWVAPSDETEGWFQVGCRFGR